VLLVTILRSQRTALLPVYALGLAICAVLNVFVVVIVAAHAVTVVLLARRRSTVVWWSIAAGATAALLIPFLLYCENQIAQVGWISPLGWHTVVEIAQEQYFDHSVPFAILAGVTLVAAAVLRRVLQWPPGSRELVAIAGAWIVAPTAVLLLYSVFSHPIYYPRYLSFTTPAMALLLGVCVAALARTRERTAAALVVFSLAATPNYVFTQRGPYAKERMDYSKVADLIKSHARDGDCLILDNTITWKPGPIRPMTAARPDAYAHLVDPGKGMTGAQRNWLWDAHIAIWAVTDKVRRCTVLWTVSQRDDTRPDHEAGAAMDPGPWLSEAPAYRVPEALGFHIVERWQFSFAQVVKSTR
jgi:mannosyltransferase